MIRDRTNKLVVMDTTFTRLVEVKFKPGMREEGIKIIDSFPKERSKGFEGILALYPMDDSNSATVITLWRTEEDLMASQQDIFQAVTKATEGVRDGPPEVKNFKVRDMRAQVITVPA